MIEKGRLIPVLHDLLDHATRVDRITADDVEQAADRVLALDPIPAQVAERRRLTGITGGRKRRWWDDFDQQVTAMEDDVEGLAGGVTSPPDDALRVRREERKDDVL